MFCVGAVDVGVADADVGADLSGDRRSGLRVVREADERRVGGVEEERRVVGEPHRSLGRVGLHEAVVRPRDDVGFPAVARGQVVERHEQRADRALIGSRLEKALRVQIIDEVGLNEASQGGQRDRLDGRPVETSGRAAGGGHAGVGELVSSPSRRSDSCCS